MGRYRDLVDPNALHEAHSHYRREQTARPNLLPPAALALPIPGSPTVAPGALVLRDHVTAELNQ